MVDEASNTGKSVNTVVSMLYHFLAVHSFGEKSVHFHWDNCLGQNKNRFLMYYMVYQISCSLHDDIKVSFLPIGDTKFSPDWCFGLFKWHFQRSKVGFFNESATPSVAQLVGSQCGNVIVPMYDWSSYFENKTLKASLKGSHKCTISIYLEVILER